MKYILSLFSLILNAINTPLSSIFKKVKKWYQTMKKEDKVIYIAFAPFYYILVILVFLINYPKEKIDKIIKK